MHVELICKHKVMKIFRFFHYIWFIDSENFCFILFLKDKNDKVFTFEGYLRENMITSQNVSSEAQVKNFLFRKKIMFHFQDIQVFVFLTIP